VKIIVLFFILCLPLRAQSACVVYGLNSKGSLCSVNEFYALDSNGSVTSTKHMGLSSTVPIVSTACIYYQGAVYYFRKELADPILINSTLTNK
jgi:hypothetical protein